MVGDHAPSFLKDIQPKDGLTELQQEISKRSVPYMIWANFELNESTIEYYDYVNLTDLSSVVLKICNLPNTVYQKEILSLREKVPVKTANGLLMLGDGNIEELTVDSEYYDLINDYYCLEYSNITGENYSSEVYELNN